MNGIWHFGGVLSFNAKPWSSQMSVYDMQMTELLTSLVWIKWPMFMGRWKLVYLIDGIFSNMWWGPEVHFSAIHPWPSPHGAAYYCMALCSKNLYTVPGSWIHPSSCVAKILYSPYMSPMEHVWDAMEKESSNFAVSEEGTDECHNYKTQLYTEEVCCILAFNCGQPKTREWNLMLSNRTCILPPEEENKKEKAPGANQIKKVWCHFQSTACELDIQYCNWVDFSTYFILNTQY